MSMFDNNPNTSAKGAVPGTSISPYNTGERKNFHYIENIFNPEIHPVEDLHKYVVPQEGEVVFDIPNGVIHRVSHVDWQATLKSTLVPWRMQNVDEGNTTEQDWIFGVRGGPLLGEALLTIDFSIRPNRARVDSTIMRPGAAYAKLYLGNDISENGKVISAQYDQSASPNMISNQVPVKLAEIVDRTNLMIMTTGPFSVTDNELALPDGTRATLVFYDQGGNFIPPAQPVMVQHGAYMRDHQLGTKYVTEVELRSPWFTNANTPEKMLIPINVNLGSIEFRAVVHYSDGTSEVHPVNSGRFALFGLNEYRPKWPGQAANVTLVYSLAPGEQHYIASPGSPNFKSREYTLEASAVKGAYSPKIYTYPQWDGAINGYRLQHFLYDLDRKTLIDVTAFVKYNDKSPVYRPASYGVAQNLIFNLNLKDVSNTNESVIFIQHTEIVLLKDVNGPGSRWSVNFDISKATYVAKVASARNAGANTTINLTNGFANQAAWLAGMYQAVQPSWDSWNEEKAPAPTHFDFMHEDGRRWRYSVADWNKANMISIELQRGKTYFINWINRSSSGVELQLATTGVTVELV